MRQDSPTYYRAKNGEDVEIIVAAFGCGPNQVTASKKPGPNPPTAPSTNATTIRFTASGSVGDRITVGIGVSFLANDSPNASFAVNLSGSLGGGAFYGGTIYRPDPKKPTKKPIIANYYFEIA